MQLQQQAAEFKRLNAAVLVIDGQELFRAQWWQQKLKIAYPILADPAARVQGLYGVARQLVVHDEWVNIPAAFVIDKQGKLTFGYWGRAFNDRVTAAQLVAEVRKAA